MRKLGLWVFLGIALVAAGSWLLTRRAPLVAPFRFLGGRDPIGEQLFESSGASATEYAAVYSFPADYAEVADDAADELDKRVWTAEQLWDGVRFVRAPAASGGPETVPHRVVVWRDLRVRPDRKFWEEMNPAKGWVTVHLVWSGKPVDSWWDRFKEFFGFG